MLNHITIMGRLTADPEIRRTQSGVAVASFSLAVDQDFKAENGTRETDFIPCVAWRGTAEFVSKYFTKGRMAVVSGRLQIRSWTDSSGNKRRSAEVVAESVYFGDSRPSGDACGSYGASAPTSAPQGYPPAPSSYSTQQSFPTAPPMEVLDDEDAHLPF